jgi:cytochrome c
MKNRLFLLAMMSAWILTSCGSKKEEAKEDSTYDKYEGGDESSNSGETDLVALGKALVDASDCSTCHHPTNKIVGPAHADVAAKYDFTEANVKMLAGKIINGGSGVWGEIPMNAHVDVSQADAENMARYVLSLDGETEQ